MDRPEEHITDSRGQTQLRNALEPLGWTLAPILSDYGIDFDVEVFRDHKTTGITFKAQLKSSRSTLYSASQDFISETLPRKSARYLIHEMQTPTILVHADVETGRIFWVAPQLEREIADKTEQPSDDGSVTFRIPTSNALPETVEGLLNAISLSKVLIATRTITQAPVRNFVAVLGDQPDADDVIRELRNKADALQAQQAFDQMYQGNLAASEAALRALWDDPKTGLETRFSVALTWEQMETRRAIQERWPDQKREALKLTTADRLDTLVEQGPPQIRAYALMFRKVAELDVLLQEQWGILLRIDVAKKQGIDPVSAAEMVFRLANITVRVGRKMRQCYHLVNYATRSSQGYALVDPLVRLAKSVLRMSGQFQAIGDGSGNLAEQAFELIRLAAALAERIQDHEAFMRTVVTARLLSDDPESASFQWMTNELTKVTDPAIRAAAEEYLNKLDRRANGEELPFTIETTDEQVLENLAAGVGVDVTDTHNAIARAVRAGIRDLNPTRVLRNCEHLSVEGRTPALVVSGLPLPIGSERVIHCGKHGHHVRGPSLDDAYAEFQHKHCASCRDLSPRPVDWRYVEIDGEKT